MQQSNGSSARLIVRRGPQPNQIYELNKDVITIGRDITNDITINDPEVSRHHARILRQGDTFIMEDLGSTNGTFINGQRLSGSRPLNAGETVGLGETVTLAFETTIMPNIGQSGSPVVSSSSPPPLQQPSQPSYEPPAQQPAAVSPYAPPAGTATPPPNIGQQPAPPTAYGGEQPPSPYTYAQEQPSGGGMAQWILLGCGCFIVLCAIGAVFTLIIVDQTCAWDTEPISSLIDIFGLTADTSSSACQ